MNTYTRFVFLFGIVAAVAFAQQVTVGQSSFSVATQGVATEFIFMAKWLGIICCICCAVGIMSGGAHMFGKISGLLAGLVFAVGADRIVNWIATHV